MERNIFGESLEREAPEAQRNREVTKVPRAAAVALQGVRASAPTYWATRKRTAASIEEVSPRAYLLACGCVCCSIMARIVQARLSDATHREELPRPIN